MTFTSRGPNGTPFEFGVFVARLHFPSDYPLSPPRMKFISDIFHPNGTKYEYDLHIQWLPKLSNKQ